MRWFAMTFILFREYIIFHVLFWISIPILTRTTNECIVVNFHPVVMPFRYEFSLLTHSFWMFLGMNEKTQSFKFWEFVWTAFHVKPHWNVFLSRTPWIYDVPCVILNMNTHIDKNDKLMYCGRLKPLYAVLHICQAGEFVDKYYWWNFLFDQ